MRNFDGWNVAAARVTPTCDALRVLLLRYTAKAPKRAKTGLFGHQCNRISVVTFYKPLSGIDLLPPLLPIALGRREGGSGGLANYITVNRPKITKW